MPANLSNHLGALTSFGRIHRSRVPSGQVSFLLPAHERLQDAPALYPAGLDGSRFRAAHLCRETTTSPDLLRKDHHHASIS